MFVPLENTPMRYAWGARGAISDLLGVGGALDEPEQGEPLQAELWFGAHHASPSRLRNPEVAGGATTVREWIERAPETALGARAAGVHEEAPQLPFLLKVLAAQQPLSLQVHPTLEQARAGFDSEDAAGVPRDAPHRNYRDRLHKPELLVALSETMSALAGFRDHTEVRELVAEVESVVAGTEAAAGFAQFVARLERAHDQRGMRELLTWILGDAAAADAAAAIDTWVEAPDSAHSRVQHNLHRIRSAFPGDASALIALLMNHVVLHRGEALYVRAGVLHAYLEGLGIEVMASSDNVLRGGLTVKHIDVDELLRILDVATQAPPLLAPSVHGNVAAFTPAEPDFMLQRANSEHLDDRIEVVGPGIAVCVAGSVQLEGGASGVAKTLGRGDAVYITPDEGAVHVRGRGDVLLATMNPHAVDSQEMPR